MFDMGMNDQRRQADITSTHNMLPTSFTDHLNTDENTISAPISWELRGTGRSSFSAKKQRRVADPEGGEQRIQSDVLVGTGASNLLMGLMAVFGRQ